MWRLCAKVYIIHMSYRLHSFCWILQSHVLGHSRSRSFDDQHLHIQSANWDEAIQTFVQIWWEPSEKMSISETYLATPANNAYLSKTDVDYTTRLFDLWWFEFWNSSSKTIPNTLPETNIALENGWLEDEISFRGPAYLWGQTRC